MKNTTKKNSGIPCYVATCAEIGTEDDNDVICLGVFTSKHAARRAIDNHVDEYLSDWEEDSGGEACREDNSDDGTIEVNSGDDRYIRYYTIAKTTFFN